MPDSEFPPTIRSVTQDDAAAIRDIYAPYVSETPVTFEEVPPSTEEIRSRICSHPDPMPWLVADVGAGPVAYAYASPWHRRTAYRFTVEVTIYAGQSSRGRGIGRLLYNALLDELSVLGLHTALAVITVPNAASTGFHEALGFTHAGTIRQVGRKFGRWHDVGTWQLTLTGPGDGK